MKVKIKSIRHTGKYFKECKKLLIRENRGTDLSYKAWELCDWSNRLYIAKVCNRVCGYVILDDEFNIIHMQTDSRMNELHNIGCKILEWAVETKCEQEEMKKMRDIQILTSNMIRENSKMSKTVVFRKKYRCA